MSEQTPGKFRLKEWIFTIDHKRVAILYLIGSFAALLIAGAMALMMRTELISAQSGTLTSNPNTYNSWLYFHGATMILGYLIPALTGFFANYYVPLMIGAKDVAFPRVNALSVWLFYTGIILALISLFVPDTPDVMWTGYPPYSVMTSSNTALYCFTVLIMGFSSITGGVNLLTTIFRMRAPGVTWNKLNMFIWTTIGAFVLQLVFVPFLGVAVLMLLFDKYLGMNFTNVAAGGTPLIYENIFWFYSHPAVYVAFLPSVGMIFEIISTFARNRVFNYKSAVYGGIGGTVLLSGVVWGHHLFVSAVPNWLAMLMSFTTLLISVPVGLIVISLVGTLYKGAIQYKTPMVYAAGFLFLFLIGGLTGIPNAMTSIYVHIHGTYWVPGHFHYVMAVSATTAVIGGVYYIFPKMTGKMYSETLGILSFILVFIGANITFFFTMYMGVKYGMPRRYYSYAQFPEVEPFQKLATYGSYIIAIGGALILFNWIYSAFRGKPAPQNPWGSKSLEWTHAPSPPPPGNFTEEVKLPEDWHPHKYK